jgi:DNA-binding Lrp family transcriptional regulator
MATRDGGTEPVPLDDIDRSIISELTRDGRMSVTQVAENVHISRAHAYTRIGRLTSEGVLSKSRRWWIRSRPGSGRPRT